MELERERRPDRYNLVQLVLMVQLFKKVIKFFVLFYFLTFAEGNESVARKVFFGFRDRVCFLCFIFDRTKVG